MSDEPDFIPDNAIRLWVIYHFPKDCPGVEYMARLWLVHEGKYFYTNHVIQAMGRTSDDSIHGLRLGMKMMGGVNLGRLPNDDPVIVETWMT